MGTLEDFIDWPRATPDDAEGMSGPEVLEDYLAWKDERAPAILAEIADLRRRAERGDIRFWSAVFGRALIAIVLVAVLYVVLAQPPGVFCP